MDAHELKDAMIQTAVESAKAAGRDPSGSQAERFVMDVLTAPRKAQDRSKGPVTKPTLQQRYETRYAKIGEKPRVLRGDDVVRARREIAKPRGKMPRLLSQREQVMEQAKASLLGRRIRLLLRYPDWAKRLEHAYNEGARMAWREGFVKFEELQNIKIMEVINLSNSTFGDWTKEPQTRLVVSG